MGKNRSFFIWSTLILIIDAPTFALPFFEPTIFKKDYIVLQPLWEEDAQKLDTIYSAGLNKYKNALKDVEGNNTKEKINNLLFEKQKSLNTIKNAAKEQKGERYGYKPTQEQLANTKSKLEKEIQDLTRLSKADTYLNEAVRNKLLSERNVLPWETVELPIVWQSAQPSIKTLSQPIQETLRAEQWFEVPSLYVSIPSSYDFNQSQIFKEIARANSKLWDPNSKFNILLNQLKELDAAIYENGKRKAGIRRPELFYLRAQTYDFLKSILERLSKNFNINQAAVKLAEIKETMEKNK